MLVLDRAQQEEGPRLLYDYMVRLAELYDPRYLAPRVKARSPRTFPANVKVTNIITPAGSYSARSAENGARSVRAERTARTTPNPP